MKDIPNSSEQNATLKKTAEFPLPPQVTGGPTTRQSHECVSPSFPGMGPNSPLSGVYLQELYQVLIHLHIQGPRRQVNH